MEVEFVIFIFLCMFFMHFAHKRLVERGDLLNFERKIRYLLSRIIQLTRIPSSSSEQKWPNKISLRSKLVETRSCDWTLGCTRGLGVGLGFSEFFFLEDKTSAPDVFSSCSFIPRADFETSLVMVSCDGCEIRCHK